MPCGLRSGRRLRAIWTAVRIEASLPGTFGRYRTQVLKVGLGWDGSNPNAVFRLPDERSPVEIWAPTCKLEAFGLPMVTPALGHDVVIHRDLNRGAGPLSPREHEAWAVVALAPHRLPTLRANRGGTGS